MSDLVSRFQQIFSLVQEYLSQKRIGFSAVWNTASVILSIFSFGCFFYFLHIFFETKQDIDAYMHQQAALVEQYEHESGDPEEASVSASVSENDVFINISGAVKNPGLYKLASLGRVADAIEAAGGFSSSADTGLLAKQLNVALPLQDTMHIFIPSKQDDVSTLDGLISVGELKPIREAKPSPTTSTVANRPAFNANTATATELTEVKGIGEARAAAIIAKRPYSSFEDFSSRSGLIQNILADIAENYTFSTD
jgi:competence protein ComEA